jgi:hypothetical protein
MEMLIVIIICLLDTQSCCRIVTIVINQMLICVAKLKKRQINPSLIEIAEDRKDLNKLAL